MVDEDNKEDNDITELQIAVKNHVVFGGDKLLGISIVKFSNLIGEQEMEVKLFNTLKFSKKHRAILNVLTKRSHDEMAKEFVSLKSQINNA